MPGSCTSCSNETSKKCGQCRKIYVCSPECMGKLWSEHKLICTTGPTLVEPPIILPSPFPPYEPRGKKKTKSGPKFTLPGISRKQTKELLKLENLLNTKRLDFLTDELYRKIDKNFNSVDKEINKMKRRLKTNDEEGAAIMEDFEQSISSLVDDNVYIENEEEQKIQMNTNHIMENFTLLMMNTASRLAGEELTRNSPSEDTQVKYTVQSSSFKFEALEGAGAELQKKRRKLRRNPRQEEVTIDAKRGREDEGMQTKRVKITPEDPILDLQKRKAIVRAQDLSHVIQENSACNTTNWVRVKETGEVSTIHPVVKDAFFFNEAVKMIESEYPFKIPNPFLDEESDDYLSIGAQLGVQRPTADINGAIRDALDEIEIVWVGKVDSNLWDNLASYVSTEAERTLDNLQSLLTKVEKRIGIARDERVRLQTTYERKLAAAKSAHRALMKIYSEQAKTAVEKATKKAKAAQGILRSHVAQLKQLEIVEKSLQDEIEKSRANLSEADYVGAASAFAKIVTVYQLQYGWVYLKSFQHVSNFARKVREYCQSWAQERQENGSVVDGEKAAEQYFGVVMIATAMTSGIIAGALATYGKSLSLLEVKDSLSNLTARAVRWNEAVGGNLTQTEQNITEIRRGIQELQTSAQYAIANVTQNAQDVVMARERLVFAKAAVISLMNKYHTTTSPDEQLQVIHAANNLYFAIRLNEVTSIENALAVTSEVIDELMISYGGAPQQVIEQLDALKSIGVSNALESVNGMLTDLKLASETVPATQLDVEGKLVLTPELEAKMRQLLDVIYNSKVADAAAIAAHNLMGAFGIFRPKQLSIFDSLNRIGGTTATKMTEIASKISEMESTVNNEVIAKLTELASKAGNLGDPTTYISQMDGMAPKAMALFKNIWAEEVEKQLGGQMAEAGDRANLIADAFRNIANTNNLLLTGLQEVVKQRWAIEGGVELAASELRDFSGVLFAVNASNRPLSAEQLRAIYEGDSAGIIIGRFVDTLKLGFKYFLKGYGWSIAAIRNTALGKIVFSIPSKEDVLRLCKGCFNWIRDLLVAKENHPGPLTAAETAQLPQVNTRTADRVKRDKIRKLKAEEKWEEVTDPDLREFDALYTRAFNDVGIDEDEENDNPKRDSRYFEKRQYFRSLDALQTSDSEIHTRRDYHELYKDLLLNDTRELHECCTSIKWLMWAAFTLNTSIAMDYQVAEYGWAMLGSVTGWVWTNVPILLNLSESIPSITSFAAVWATYALTPGIAELIVAAVNGISVGIVPAFAIFVSSGKAKIVRRLVTQPFIAAWKGIEMAGSITRMGISAYNFANLVISIRGGTELIVPAYSEASTIAQAGQYKEMLNTTDLANDFVTNAKEVVRSGDNITKQISSLQSGFAQLQTQGAIIQELGTAHYNEVKSLGATNLVPAQAILKGAINQALAVGAYVPPEIRNIAATVETARTNWNLPITDGVTDTAQLVAELYLVN